MRLMDRGMRFLARSLPTAAASGVTYNRGTASVSIADAVAGDSQSQSTVPGQAPAQVDFSARDYLIPVASLTFDGVPTQPAAGDVVEEVINGVSCRFKAERRDQGPCWRYSDASRLVFRVFTKRA